MIEVNMYDRGQHVAYIIHGPNICH